MAKQVIYGTESRAAILRGVNRGLDTHLGGDGCRPRWRQHISSSTWREGQRHGLLKEIQISPTHQRILWVEDDKDTGEMVTFFLERSDYFVTNAVTSAEALGLAQNEYFDLYLLGDWFPHGKESNLCEQIHEFDPRSPILFYSAAAYQTDRQRGMDAGAQGYLTKPVGFDDLTEAITRLLSNATSATDAEI